MPSFDDDSAETAAHPQEKPVGDSLSSMVEAARLALNSSKSGTSGPNTPRNWRRLLRL